MDAPPRSTLIHASCVSVDRNAVLILGPSGAGKSSLALQLIGLGAVLVSDDQTAIRVENDLLIAAAPTAIAGLIEARGVGLLKVPVQTDVPVALVVDLAKEESDRLPHSHAIDIQGITLPCLFSAPSPHFATAILLYLRGSIGQHS